MDRSLSQAEVTFSPTLAELDFIFFQDNIFVGAFMADRNTLTPSASLEIRPSMRRIKGWQETKGLNCAIR